uniref:Uncharacterized protein n=1 Tax=Timema douglasi TaxID=61478 RepID=A0A7R8VB45_TIMDO|nr:unnamed protein product [Timema douglasi]
MEEQGKRRGMKKGTDRIPMSPPLFPKIEQHDTATRRSPTATIPVPSCATSAPASVPKTSEAPPPSYPAVLKDRPPSFGKSHNLGVGPKVPPPVPPRGSPHVKNTSAVAIGRGGSTRSYHTYHFAHGRTPLKSKPHFLPPDNASNCLGTGSRSKSLPACGRPYRKEWHNDMGGLARSYSPVPCSSTPPPAFEDALRGELVESPPRHRLGPAHITHHHHVVKSYRESEVVSISDVRLECRAENKSSLSVESSSSTSGFGSGATGRNLTWTPPASVEGSTPTLNEHGCALGRRKFAIRNSHVCSFGV